MERRRLRPAIDYLDPDQQIGRRGLGVGDKDVIIAITFKDAGVDQLIFRFLTAAPAVGLQQVDIGIGGLRVFVEIVHIGMGRRRVKIVIVFFDIFAVVAFAIGQAKEALLENRVLSIPKRQ